MSHRKNSETDRKHQNARKRCISQSSVLPIRLEEIVKGNKSSDEKPILISSTVLFSNIATTKLSTGILLE
jgi:hypothetical protein